MTYSCDDRIAQQVVENFSVSCMQNVVLIEKQKSYDLFGIVMSVMLQGLSSIG